MFQIGQFSKLTGATEITKLFENDQVELDPALFPSILLVVETEYIDMLMEHVDRI